MEVMLNNNDIITVGRKAILTRTSPEIKKIYIKNLEDISWFNDIDIEKFSFKSLEAIEISSELLENNLSISNKIRAINQKLESLGNISLEVHLVEYLNDETDKELKTETEEEESQRKLIKLNALRAKMEAEIKSQTTSETEKDQSVDSIVSSSEDQSDKSTLQVESNLNENLTDGISKILEVIDKVIETVEPLALTEQQKTEIDNIKELSIELKQRYDSSPILNGDHPEESTETINFIHNNIQILNNFVQQIVQTKANESTEQQKLQIQERMAKAIEELVKINKESHEAQIKHFEKIEKMLDKQNSLQYFLSFVKWLFSGLNFRLFKKQSVNSQQDIPVVASLNTPESPENVSGSPDNVPRSPDNVPEFPDKIPESSDEISVLTEEGSAELKFDDSDFNEDDPFNAKQFDTPRRSIVGETPIVRKEKKSPDSSDIALQRQLKTEISGMRSPEITVKVHYDDNKTAKSEPFGFKTFLKDNPQLVADEGEQKKFIKVRENDKIVLEATNDTITVNEGWEKYIEEKNIKGKNKYEYMAEMILKELNAPPNEIKCVNSHDPKSELENAVNEAYQAKQPKPSSSI